MANQFAGFELETFAFLRDLTLHNDRDWFTANRARYEEHYLAPALGFIEAVGPRLAAELPGDVRFEARVNGSLFRINRDVRFSRDKTPYKNHIDMWFWTGRLPSAGASPPSTCTARCRARRRWPGRSARRRWWRVRED